MNRNNIWIHIGLAVVLITFAAVLGRIDRWRSSLSVSNDRSPAVPSAPPAPPVPGSASKGERDAEVLVRFKPGVTLGAIKFVAARNHDVIVDEIEAVNGLVAIDDLDDADPESVARQYGQMTDLVSYAEPNFRIELGDPLLGRLTQDKDPNTYEPGQPNDPQFSDQWALHNLGQNGGKQRADIDALKAWARTRGSADVVVAVLDTGVDYTHIDLRSNMWLRPENVPQYVDDELGRFEDERGFDVDTTLSDPMDDNGHGTHVAGIIGAEGDNAEGITGVNWNVQLMPLKFLGRGGFGTTKDAIAAINYAIDRKKNGVNVRIINASWGSTSRSKALEDAIRAAGNAGIIFIAAAGNNSGDNDKRPHYPSNYDLPNVISVASLDNTDQLSSFSNYGLKTVHVAAPGREILSTWLGDAYREASGTSMATPYVSGVAALIIASEPSITVAELRRRLLNSVDKIDTLSSKVASGGRINAARALGR